MSHRTEQAQSLMHRAIAQVLQRELSDPRIQGLVGITRVSITADFRRADVYVTVMPEKYEKRTLAGLRAATVHIHGRVKKLVALRTVPHLQFELDKTIKKQAIVEDAIREGIERTIRSQPAEPKTDPDGSPPIEG